MWLPRAEQVSDSASGAQEVDEELRLLLADFFNKEKELEVATLAAKDTKEAAATSFDQAKDLCNELYGRHLSRPTPAGMDKEEAQLDDDNLSILSRWIPPAIDSL
ncbi:uncharacterized protein MELLADRAFT_112893 [Melampsora larici-populina 98AG31]|uniref:Uncharacterized protein n=1 Tax=Melampsora larici-populina (strain 98AG31 / pathotype 3-4-7) TaxID=747676 RepID=F4S813_MELLP|nr:uncharacterized protein MELLADRAFT_112893 [Melampsora larici-populina 98AG31]EGF99206.1 hypothetical protein MELLADRAFT_112893 [Melampsora larici-populina 98AG31]